MRPSESLRRRIVVAFLSFAFVCSLFFAAIAVIGVEGMVADLEAAGHPVVEIAYDDADQLGAEFFRWMFATAGLLAVILALATISFQAIKAALANPVKSLRSE